MAANSIRERLILDVISNLEQLSSINSVGRVKLGLDDLESIPQTQLPHIIVSGELPKPTPKFSSRTQGIVDKFISELSIMLMVYGLDKVNPDSTISSLVDDIWVKLMADPTRNGLALSTLIHPDLVTDILDPYFAFIMDVRVTYTHSTTSI